LVTDPNIKALKPAMLMIHILDRDEKQVGECWKCLAIMGSVDLSYGDAKSGLVKLHDAVDLVNRDTGDVPAWLGSKLVFAQQAASQKP
jgi:hypothetical protein